MITQEMIVSSADWVSVSSGGAEYMIQNTGTNRVLIKASGLKPTDETGSVVLLPFQVMSSKILTGDIWVKATEMGGTKITFGA